METDADGADEYMYDDPTTDGFHPFEAQDEPLKGRQAVMARTVVIDGVTYVPALEAVAQIDALDTMMQALFEVFWGTTKMRWNTSGTNGDLWIDVNDDERGDTFAEVAASLARTLGGQS